MTTLAFGVPAGMAPRRSELAEVADVPDRSATSLGVLTEGRVRLRSSLGDIRAVSGQAVWAADAARDIAKWQATPAGWDSYGARAISDTAVRRGYALVKVLSEINVPRPFITGTNEGGLNFQWDTERFDLQIYVGAASAQAFCLDKETDEQWEGPLSDAIPLKRALGMLAAD